MNKLVKNKPLLIIVIGIIILAGIIVIATMGFNFDLKYKKTQRIELNLEKEFEISDIKQITDEIFGKEQVIIQKVEIYEDAVSITAKEITDEQKNNLVTKINEKYETEISSDDISTEEIPHTKLRDIAKPYVIPFTLATVIILVYVAIRYYKLGAEKIVVKTLGRIILYQAVLFSLIAITRMPIGYSTIPMVLAVYLISLVEFGKNKN